MRFRNLIFYILVICSALGCAKAQSFQHFRKVVWVVFENTNYRDVVNQPDFAWVAKQGAFLTNYTAETHPSQGNYIAMIAGSSMGVRDDMPQNLSGAHIGDLLEKANMDWRVYAEDYPGNCFLGDRHGLYVRKHVPFLSFTNVSTALQRCQKIKSAERFKDDLHSGNLADFNLYIPNLENSGHDTGLDYAGSYLKNQFGELFANPSNLKNVLFIVTFDEDEFTNVNHIYTAILGTHVKAGTQISQALGHPALLKMIEDEFGIGNLGRGDAQAAPIEGIWK